MIEELLTTAHDSLVIVAQTCEKMLRVAGQLRFLAFIPLLSLFLPKWYHLLLLISAIE